MSSRDISIAVLASLVLALASYSGGLNGWGGAADSLPFVVWAVSLPALGVWFGRRATSALPVLLVTAALGAAFFAPSLLVYRSRNPEEDLIALAISIAIPVIFGGLAFGTRRSEPYPNAAGELLPIARATKSRALFGIVLFPQFVQPAVLATTLRIAKEGGAGVDESVSAPLRVARAISAVLVALLVVWTVLAVGASLLDAM